ncbi:MAG: hypothetical protein WA118_10565 [Carboxydocellales bacterium]
MKLESAEEKRIESKLEISTYLDRLKYALNSGQAMIQFQEIRKVDEARNPRYTNRFTIADLFPDEERLVVLKRELASLDVENYIETVKDKRRPKLSEMRVFGKKYHADVYIKIRVELVSTLAAGANYIFVMSFHYAETAFNDMDFPYKNS